MFEVKNGKTVIYEAEEVPKYQTFDLSIGGRYTTTFHVAETLGTIQIFFCNNVTVKVHKDE